MISVSYGMSIIAITQYDTDIIGINAMIIMLYDILMDINDCYDAFAARYRY